MSKCFDHRRTMLMMIPLIITDFNTYHHYHQSGMSVIILQHQIDLWSFEIGERWNIFMIEKSFLRLNDKTVNQRKPVDWYHLSSGSDIWQQTNLIIHLSEMIWSIVFFHLDFPSWLFFQRTVIRQLLMDREKEREKKRERYGEEQYKYRRIDCFSITFNSSNSSKQHQPILIQAIQQLHKYWFLALNLWYWALTGRRIFDGIDSDSDVCSIFPVGKGISWRNSTERWQTTFDDASLREIPSRIIAGQAYTWNRPNGSKDRHSSWWNTNHRVEWFTWILSKWTW